MSSDNPPGGGGGNRTIFRPSPLSGMRQGQTPAQPPQQGGSFPPPPPTPQGGNFAPVPTWGNSAQAPPPMPAAPPSFGQVAQPSAMQPVSTGYVQGGDAALPAGFVAPQPYQGAPVVQGRLSDEDIPLPSQPRETRSPLVMEAGPVLALAASVRSGRARIAMPNFHKEATDLVGAYDRSIAGIYPEEVRMRALYALCATVDDIAQNLPNIGQDGAEWARRSLVITFFRENIGGDRFWQLVDDVLSKPALNSELIELFADCLAAGFEGRFRIMPDGRTRLQQIFNSLYGALEHPRSLSQVEISPQWRGAQAPLGKLGMWNKVALAIAAALAGLLLIYIVLRLLLMSAGGLAWDSVSGLTPKDPLRLSRAGAPPPAGASGPQASKLRKFLEPEITQKLVVVEEDASTVRVRTTVGQLFQSGSDQLATGRQGIFERIGRAVEGEPGDVTIEGHADSDKISSLSFPDNAALSKARAQTVSGIIGGILSNPARVHVEGYGDSRPIGDNKTPEGKALNRRVEVIIPRRN